MAVYFESQTTGITADSKPLWEREVTTAGEFEVLPDAPPGLLTLTDDPSLADTIRKSMTVVDARRHRSPDGKGIDLTISVNAIPVNLAFEVFGRVGGQEHPIGTLTVPRGSTGNYGFGSFEFPPPPGDRVDLVFRSSDKALRGTVDLYDAWRGEVVIENVEVKRQQP
jgi:hypothetical protein